MSLLGVMQFVLNTEEATDYDDDGGDYGGDDDVMVMMLTDVCCYLFIFKYFVICILLKLTKNLH